MVKFEAEVIGMDADKNTITLEVNERAIKPLRQFISEKVVVEFKDKSE